MTLDYKKVFECELERFVEALQGPQYLRQACAYALLAPGKRLRPSLVYQVGRAAGTGDVTASAIAVECFHTASLIADDLPCMDDEVQRRGRPALHQKYGEAVALLASYALIAEGYAQIAYAGGESMVGLAVQEASRSLGLQGAAGGQYYDLFSSEHHLEQMIAMKTGALFELSFVLGWLFGGGDRERLPLVKQSAYHFGRAFQLHDDLLDLSTDRPSCNFASHYGVDRTQQEISNEITAFRKLLPLLPVEFPDLTRLLAPLLPSGSPL